MHTITFTKGAVLIALLSFFFLFSEYKYKTDLYYQEKIYDLELQYKDKVKTFQDVAKLCFSEENTQSSAANRVGSWNNSESIIRLMEKNLDARYSMVIRRDHVSKIMGRSTDAYYHNSCFDNRYVMRNTLHNQEMFDKKRLKAFKHQIQREMAQEHSFALHRFNNLGSSTLFVFASITDAEHHPIGYLISKREDSYINRIVLEQFLKFLSVVFVLYIVHTYYRKHLRSLSLLDQYKAVVDKTTLLSKTDVRGRITYVNDAFEELSGYSKEELIGKQHNIVRHPDMASSVFAQLWKTIQSGTLWHGRIKNRKKDGSAYIVDATIFPITDEKGRIVEYIAIRHDVTELEELKELLEKDLQNSNRTLEEKMSLLTQYERAIEQSASYTRTNLEGIITYLNETHERLSGYTKEELIGKTHKVLRDPSTPGSFYRDLWDTIQQKNIWKGVIKNRTKEGGYVFLDTIIVPILDQKGELREYMSIQYDVTELLFLQEEIVETQREVIYKMGEISETRSKETGNHVKRVAEYSRLLAIKAGMSEEEADMLYTASPMHDIGKVGIPDSILKKPGKLNDEEWEVMRTHSDIGYYILKSSERPILKAAAIISHQHHEKWDGTGYPMRLRGEEIHMYGRITAVADVFDALGSDRVYKKGWELDEILQFFTQQKGKHFDPRLIDLFFENLSEFLAIRDSLRD